MSSRSWQGILLAFGISLLVNSSDCLASGPGKKPDAKTSAVTTNDVYRPFLINNVFNYYGNNGDGSYDKFSSNNEGFEFPKGSGKTIIFEDGVLWGSRHKGADTPKVGGSSYRHGLQAGPIITPGTLTTDPIAADTGTLQYYRVFRVRPDIHPGVDFFAVKTVLDTSEVVYTGRYEPLTAQDLYNQYIKDWNEWPAALGAPYTDINGNGVYDPSVDIPGVPGADQTLWYVANDLSRSRLASLVGTIPPIGLEMQRTIWGYRRTGALAKTIFQSTVLVNKSGAPIDSMFLLQWADPDLGDGNDDFVGCDTTRALGYVYNSRPTDGVYGTSIPAGGFVLLQGPLVASPGDSAVFKLKYRKGFKNLPMTAFTFFIGGNTTFTDPSFDAAGAIQWYRLMRGTISTTGGPYIDPNTHLPTKFCLAGDPVAKTGWVDGQGGMSAGDRRIDLVSGPFNMAAGDTQEIVTANLAAFGSDNLSSVTALKTASDQVRSHFQLLFADLSPRVTAGAAFPSSSQALVTVSVDGAPWGAATVSGSFRTAEGVTSPAFDFYDDGTHGDPQAGDKQFTAVQSYPATLKPISLDLSLADRDGIRHDWPGVLQGITVAGPLEISGLLFSDNINSDGQVNPGENIRFGVVTTNRTQFILQGLSVLDASRPTSMAHAVGALAPGASDTMHYNQNDFFSYFSADVPASSKDSLLNLTVLVNDSLGNQWFIPVTFPVVPLHDTIRAAVVNQVSVLSGEGSWQISVVKPEDVRAHLYVIYGVSRADSAGSPGFTLKDSTDGRLLLLNHPLPDELGHNVPVTDGFKVLRGSIVDGIGIRSWSAEGTNRVWSYADGVGFGLEAFGGSLDTVAPFHTPGTIGIAYYSWFTGGVGPGRMRQVEIRFAAVGTDSTWSLTSPTDPNISKGYRYLRSAAAAPAQPQFAPWIVNKTSGYAYQDYNYSIPWSAWNMDVTPPQRLAVGHLENNRTGGRVDGRWWPDMGATVGGTANTDAGGPREWFFIFDVPYSSTPDTSLTKDILNTTVPMMYMGTVTRRGPFGGTEKFLITPFRQPKSGDIWTFNPTILLSAPGAGSPLRYALEQNYPNPFNPSTTIRFELPSASRVRLTVYDLLGREVVTLLNGTAGAGMHEVKWEANNVASGVYFYRLEATPQDGRGGKRVETRKMITLR